MIFWNQNTDHLYCLFLQRDVELELLSSHRGGNTVASPLPIPHTYNSPTITHVTTPPPIFLSEVRGSQLDMLHARNRQASNSRRPRSNRTWQRRPSLPHPPFPGLLLHFLYVIKFYTHIKMQFKNRIKFIFSLICRFKMILKIVD